MTSNLEERVIKSTRNKSYCDDLDNFVIDSTSDVTGDHEGILENPQKRYLDVGRPVLSISGEIYCQSSIRFCDNKGGGGNLSW